jgi:hypothetical protein
MVLELAEITTADTGPINLIMFCLDELSRDGSRSASSDHQERNFLLSLPLRRPTIHFKKGKKYEGNVPFAG